MAHLPGFWLICHSASLMTMDERNQKMLEKVNPLCQSISLLKGRFHRRNIFFSTKLLLPFSFISLSNGRSHPLSLLTRTVPIQTKFNFAI